MCGLEWLLPAERAAEGVRPDRWRAARVQRPRHHPLHPKDGGQKWVSHSHFSGHKKLGFPAFRDAQSDDLKGDLRWSSLTCPGLSGHFSWESDCSASIRFSWWRFWCGPLSTASADVRVPRNKTRGQVMCTREIKPTGKEYPKITHF